MSKSKFLSNFFSLIKAFSWLTGVSLFSLISFMQFHSGHYNTISQYQVPSLIEHTMTGRSTEFCSHVLGFLCTKITNSGLLDPLLKQDKNPRLYSSSNENVSLNRVAMVVLLHFGGGDPEAYFGIMLKTCVV